MPTTTCLRTYRSPYHHLPAVRCRVWLTVVILRLAVGAVDSTFLLICYRITHIATYLTPHCPCVAITCRGTRIHATPRLPTPAHTTHTEEERLQVTTTTVVRIQVSTGWTYVRYLRSPTAVVYRTCHFRLQRLTYVETCRNTLRLRSGPHAALGGWITPQLPRSYYHYYTFAYHTLIPVPLRLFWLDYLPAGPRLPTTAPTVRP